MSEAINARRRGESRNGMQGVQYNLWQAAMSVRGSTNKADPAVKLT